MAVFPLNAADAQIIASFEEQYSFLAKKKERETEKLNKLISDKTPDPL